MSRLMKWAGALVLGAASLMGCCCCHHYDGAYHDPYYGCYHCGAPCYHAPYCCYCGYYHYGCCH